MVSKKIKKYKVVLLLLLHVGLISCASNSFDTENINLQDTIVNENNNNSGPIRNHSTQNNNSNEIKYLALGDSYTIGTSVCATCNYPTQLQEKLSAELNSNINLDIIAQNGWNTTALIEAINNQDLSNDFDLVTLLIGVNNQFQQKPFDVYIVEFSLLLNRAIQLANGNLNRVIVISIPDYAFTPFGQDLNDAQLVSNEIDLYNDFAKKTSESKNVKFLNITDITRRGLNDPRLVASDGLHPSEKAYTKFVERLLPFCLEIIND